MHVCTKAPHERGLAAHEARRSAEVEAHRLVLVSRITTCIMICITINLNVIMIIIISSSSSNIITSSTIITKAHRLVLLSLPVPSCFLLSLPGESPAFRPPRAQGLATLRLFDFYPLIFTPRDVGFRARRRAGAG